MERSLRASEMEVQLVRDQVGTGGVGEEIG